MVGPHRDPKLVLDYGNAKIYFYSCAIKELGSQWRRNYDWSIDLMSPKWDADQALKMLTAKTQRTSLRRAHGPNLIRGPGKYYEK